jgi:uncharacterized protein YjbI with pentapeptide repeats
MSRAKFLDDPMFHLLRHGKIAEFNAQRAAGQNPDLRDADLRGTDLRELDAAGLDLCGCYLRQADLRGLDLSQTRLDGASLFSAKISGALFPRELSAEEINLSLTHGTRMRYR